MRVQKVGVSRRTMEYTPTTVRMDSALRDMVVRSAAENDRTFTAELERRLRQSFEAEGREVKVRKGARG